MTDEMMTCPYNKAHHVSRARYQRHIFRCKQSYPNVILRRCPLNALHMIPPEQFNNHISTCPDRKLLKQMTYDFNRIPVKDDIIDPSELKDLVGAAAEGDWDDSNAGSYDPLENTSSADIIRHNNLMGTTPAVKKAFRETERLRRGDIKWDEIEEEASDSDSDDD